MEEPKGEYSAEFKDVLDARVENYKNGVETVSPEDMSKRINFLFMTTITVYIDDKKTEKAIKALFEALDLNYKVERDVKPAKLPLKKGKLI